MGTLYLGNRKVTIMADPLGVPRVVDNGVYKIPTLTSYRLPANVTSLDAFALSYAFRGCTTLTTIDISNIQTLSSSSSLLYAFYGCTGLTGTIDLSKLTSISGASSLSYAFYGCTGITGVDFSNLTTATGTSLMASGFRGCSHLNSVSFPKLTRIGTNSSSTNYAQFSYAFYGTGITELRFPELKEIYCTGGTTASYGTFSYNNTIQKVYFPKVTTITYGSGASSTNRNAVKNLFSNCGALTEIHFALANKTSIEASSGYSTAWGSNATVYFDL